MSHLRVGPARAPLTGAATVPGDKSIGHRAVILAALASGRSTLRGLSAGEDNRRTVAALRALGVVVEAGEPGAFIVSGVGIDGLRAPAAALDCGNSGTTMRLLAGVLAPSRFGAVLDGDDSLRARPMGRVTRPLGAMGAVIEGATGTRPGEVYPPLRLGPARTALRGIEHRAPVASAQVKSAVLLAALSAGGVTRFVEPARSRDHTERMLRAMGAPVSVDGTAVIVDPRGWDRRLRARDLAVPGDLSAAAFLLGAALIVPGSDIVVRGVCVNPTRTGVLDALAAMGANISIEGKGEEGSEPVADVRARGGALRGARIDGELALRAIDEIPLLCALAAHAQGETVIADAAELRVKESDRIAAMAAALRALGVPVVEREDGMAITGGGAVRGGRVDSRGDHRVAMACAVCALAARGDTRIDDADNVATSFPGFAASLRALGAPIDERPGAADEHR